MEYITLALSVISTLLLVIVLFVLFKNKKTGDISLGDSELKKIRESVNESVNSLSKSISELVSEKNSSLMNDLNKQIKEMNDKVDSLSKTINDFILKFTENNNKHKEELMDKLSTEMKEFNKTVKDTLSEFKKENSDSIKSLQETVSKNLSEIREDNNNKLDKINTSVNETLAKTLEDKLKTSFEGVIKGIGEVNVAVGEIKGLATDVGSLKNVLTNVKTKGIMGEVILGNIIKEFLTVNQYDENVVTKKNSTERVEFAIKLPGQRDETIYLPVDSKFPYEAYSRIQESNDIDEINNARKELRKNLLQYAKDVSDKYIDVPYTTDFAIIFLPLEGLYLEALNMGLFEEIQSKYKINLTGPTTFTAFINSLNMGFKTLMIQKKSADIFKLLGAVKTEFNKFADALDKTQKKVNQAADELDSLVGTRTRMLNSKLKSVEALNEEESKYLLEGEIDTD